MIILGVAGECILNFVKDLTHIVAKAFRSLNVKAFKCGDESMSPSDLGVGRASGLPSSLYPCTVELVWTKEGMLLTGTFVESAKD